VTAAQRKEINRLAETIREGLELDLPVRVEQAVERLGGTLEFGCLDSKVEALIQKDGERFKIVVRDTNPPARNRFSVAHELGHLFLHMGYLVDPDKWTNAKEYTDSVYFRYGHGVEEDEANEFAAAFLMPESEFKQAVRSAAKDGDFSIEDVAKVFDASTAAVARRGRLLGIFGGD
jgi:Zn-dependent peptidase ImmA (M78 family)